jgi:transcription initiation factor TFIID subunit 5
MEFSEDNLFVAVGCSDSTVMVWSLDGKPLESIVPSPPGTAPPTSMRRLIGHSGPVYGVSFSPAIARSENASEYTPDLKPTYLLSCSADKTIRLWSLDTWTCMVVYKGHDDIVWDVKWGAFGHYFLTGSHDKTARLWSVDQISFLRIFVAHDQDVDAIAFHPNSAYVFTGSSDKMVRMWSVQTGQPVRMFTGHLGAVTSLACSPDGKILASAGDDGLIILHGLAEGNRIKVMRGHAKGGIWSLSWSAESNVVVSGGADGTVRVWDVKKKTDNTLQSKTVIDGNQPKAGGDASQSGAGTQGTITSAASGTAPGAGTSSQPAVAGVSTGTGGPKKKGKEISVTADQISAFPTKKSPVYNVKFTRMNLVVAGGAYFP